MTREEVLHADPRRTWPTSSSSTRRAIDEATRFKEDLEADSLDLYTLVQELEDSYGVKMSDEQAARSTPWARRSTSSSPTPRRREA